MTTLRHLQASSNRKAQRMAKQGEILEETVVKLLEKLQNRGVILEFAHNTRNSREDSEGKDFTFTIAERMSGAKKALSFGVTISLKCWASAKIKHPQAPQLCFPLGTKLETMEKRILELAE